MRVCLFICFHCVYIEILMNSLLFFAFHFTSNIVLFNFFDDSIFFHSFSTNDYKYFTVNYFLVLPLHFISSHTYFKTYLTYVYVSFQSIQFNIPLFSTSKLSVCAIGIKYFCYYNIYIYIMCVIHTVYVYKKKIESVSIKHVELIFFYNLLQFIAIVY